MGTISDKHARWPLALVVAALAALLALALVASTAAGPRGRACSVTVTAAGSIQAAVDAAGAGDKVCLDDSGGDFAQTVVFGPEDSGVSLRAERGDSPVLDGGGGALDAIRLLDGAGNITIDGLTIRDYGAAAFTQPGNAIQAWDVSTSNITFTNNVLDGLSWNGVLVGGEGGSVHRNWTVQGNTVSDAAFVGIELTNCENCAIVDNTVSDDALFGVVVQARSTSAGNHVAVDNVRVMRNTVGGTLYGIYVLSFVGHPTAFTPIADASATLSGVQISHNSVGGGTAAAIRLWAFNEDATAVNGRIIRNTLDCPSAPGIEILESGSGEQGTVRNVKVVNNTFDGDCDPAVTDEGEAPKLPPGPFLP